MPDHGLSARTDSASAHTPSDTMPPSGAETPKTGRCASQLSASEVYMRCQHESTPVNMLPYIPHRGGYVTQMYHVNIDATVKYEVSTMRPEGSSERQTASRHSLRYLVVH